jgi:hypothetical protein
LPRVSLPISMIVCGLPASASARSSARSSVCPRLKASVTELSSSKAATPVAPAVAAMISSAPTR